MRTTQEFMQYLAGKRKKHKYIEERAGLIDMFYTELKGKLPTAESIGAFVKNRWSGYIGRDKNIFQILSDYDDFCKLTFGC